MEGDVSGMYSTRRLGKARTGSGTWVDQKKKERREGETGGDGGGGVSSLDANLRDCFRGNKYVCLS